MISVNFDELNESSKTFILSVAVGSEVVIDSLLKTANRHLDQLDSLRVDTLNVKLHFDCSVDIISRAYNALYYINSHSADLFSDVSVNPLDCELESISNRFNLALERIKREIPLCPLEK